MRDFDFAFAVFGNITGGEGRVIATDANECGDTKLFEHRENILHLLLRFSRIRARRAENRTASQVNILYVANGQRLDLRGVALRDVFKTVAETNDFVALIDAFNGGGGDNAVQSGRRTTADQNSKSAFVAHVI